MSNDKNYFSISDFIYAKANPHQNGKRGGKEFEMLRDHTKDDWTDLFDPFSTRALTAGIASEGGNTVETSASVSPAFQNFYAPSYFLNRDRCVILDNLTSNVKIDAKNVGSVLTSKAVTETTSTANFYSTEAAWADISLKPHFIRVSLDISRQLLDQSSKSFDSLILSDIANSLSAEFDRQALIGSGTEEVTGISSTTGIGSATWGSIGSLTGPNAHTALLLAEKTIGEASVPEPYEFLLNSATRQKLRSIKKTGLEYPILTDENRIIGRDTFQTENLRASDVFMLNPAYVVIGLWHPLENFSMIVDGFTSQSVITLTLSIIGDCQIAKPSALYTLTQS